MSTARSEDFSKLRSYLWPIHNFELKKFLPMLGIFFFLSLNYNILRNLKDTLVVTAPDSGAEVIPFIKVYIMFPLAVAMTALFAWLSRKISREKIFYSIVSFFLLFFAFFITVLYPYQHFFHPSTSADYLQGVLPQGFYGLIAMYRYWTFCAFYAMSELWSNIILFVLFWAFANEITRISEAKRFYGLLGLGANIAGIVAGQISIWCAMQIVTGPDVDPIQTWQANINMLVSVVLVSGVLALALLRWMHVSVLTDARFYCPEKAKARKKNKHQFTLKESFIYIKNSPYLMSIAMIVIAYNLVINLVEVIWKHEVRALYPNPIDFNIYMNQVSTWIGIVATATALFISGNCIRRFGWTFTAMITPIILLITSIGFFSFMFFGDTLMPLVNPWLGISSLGIIVFFGSLQNVLSRGAKYTVYDATKELAFIPLSDECKLKGKTAIDGIGNRLGKSSGSLIHQLLLMLFSTLSASSPYIAVILLFLIGFWIFSTLSLGKQFNSLALRYETLDRTEQENQAAAVAAAALANKKEEAAQTQAV